MRNIVYYNLAYTVPKIKIILYNQHQSLRYIVVKCTYYKLTGARAN